MNNSQDPVEANAKKDASHVKRLEELMAEMIQNGFVEYVEQHTGEVKKLTFETVISEGIEDAEGFIPAMFQFYQNPLLLCANGIFLQGIRELLITYIEGDILYSEDGD